MSDEATGIEHNRLLVRLLGGGEPEPPADDAPLEFDGGARDTVPGPVEPEKDHDQLVVDLFRDLGANP